jgi:Amt family ammonium transporter
MNPVLCLFSIMLIPFAAAGLALIHQGLGRSRSAAHAMLATLCALAVSAIVFVLFGSALAGSAGAAAHSFTVGGAHWDWLGAAPFLSHGIDFDGSDAAGFTRALTLCLELFAAGLVAIIPLSAGTDRWRLGPICLSSALLGGIVFPIFAHWTWGGGWLAQLGTNFGIASFTDAGGAAVIQVVGGLAALSVAWVAGARRGKFSDDGIPAAIPGHNIVLVLFGCILALVGWIGLDSAASILFYDAGPQQIVGVVINAMLSASAGCLAAVVVTRARYRKPDASLSANGWIAGLVAGSAACAMISPVAAIDIGIVAGVLVTYMIEIFELRLHVERCLGSCDLWDLGADRSGALRPLLDGIAWRAHPRATGRNQRAVRIHAAADPCGKSPAQPAVHLSRGRRWALAGHGRPRTGSRSLP